MWNHLQNKICLGNNIELILSGPKLTERVFDPQFARIYENFLINRMSPHK